MSFNCMTALALMSLCVAGEVAQAAPVNLLRTPGYEAPVHAGPDDLLLLAGVGLEAGDRVVYESAGTGHAAKLPETNTAERGMARIVQIADPPYALTVRMPEVIPAGRIYRLWVLNPQGEWSEPVIINDPRPQWISPSFSYSTADLAGLGRRIRVVGRNLEGLRIRLAGPADYGLQSIEAKSSAELRQYVSDAKLPARLVPGHYTVSVSRDGRAWIPLSGQHFEVRPDPAAQPRFELGDAAVGSCHPDDDSDDSRCLSRAIESARQRGGGVVVIPEGRWDLFGNGFVVPPDVQLVGSAKSVVVRHEGRGALFTLTSRNLITGITFVDTGRYSSPREAQAVIQLGMSAESHGPADEPRDAIVEDIIVSKNVFTRVGRAIVDSGRPIARLIVTGNQIGAYDNGLLLIGGRSNVTRPFQITDSVFRNNEFLPGSYVDVAARQGAIASQIGASERMDFSENEANGLSEAALQDAMDIHGWRAGFFWNENGSHEHLLVSENHISCPGDKAGDGESFAFDGNGNTMAFNGAQLTRASSADSISVDARLINEQNRHSIDAANYYVGHWVELVAGPGIGQTRKILNYSSSPSGTVTFRVSPAWDIPPQPGVTRMAVTQQFWRTYVVANRVEQAAPCRKANLNGPKGGLISLWAPTADSVVDGNHQVDSDGIVIQQAYGASAPSCPTCGNGASFHTALEVRNNLIEGEYDWDSDCSNSGIMASFGASPTPESPPPVLGFGISIANNTLSHADGLRGGAIDVVSVWHRGPPPQEWPLVENLLISHNLIRNITGPGPRRGTCRFPQRKRIAIRLEGTSNVRDTVLYANRCEQVDATLEDSGRHTVRVCGLPNSGSCECSIAR